MDEYEQIQLVKLMDELWGAAEEGNKAAMFCVAYEGGKLEDLRDYLINNRGCSTTDALNYLIPPIDE